jgi:hypothetical protein
MNEQAFAKAVRDEVVKTNPELADGFNAATKDDFHLEPDTPPGKVPERVILELMQARKTAVSYAGAYADAAKQQAEKYKVNPAALKRYIAALVDDKVEKLRVEAEHVERLLSQGASDA